MCELWSLKRALCLLRAVVEPGSVRPVVLRVEERLQALLLLAAAEHRAPRRPWLRRLLALLNHERDLPATRIGKATDSVF